jgi:hypothetical protein
MQPRKLLLPDRPLVSQVTKRGYSSDPAPLRRFPRPRRFASADKTELPDDFDVNEVADEAFVFSDGVLDPAEGTGDGDAVDGLAPSSRLIAACREGARISAAVAE